VLDRTGCGKGRKLASLPHANAAPAIRTIVTVRMVRWIVYLGCIAGLPFPRPGTLFLKQNAGV